MTITTTTLTRAAGLAAVAAGLLFIGIQINHPPLNATTITTTEMAVRDSLKVLMAVLALVGITGIYLRQVKETGVLGLVGYLVFGTCYLSILCTSFIALTVLPSIAGSDPSYTNGVLTAAASRGGATGDIGLLSVAFTVQGVAFLAGGLLFGIALYRARILARWAAALLALGGVVSVTLSLMPDAFFRLLAFPNGIALIALGYSLWREQRASVVRPLPGQVTPELHPAGAR